MKNLIQELHSDNMAELNALGAIQQLFQLITEAYPVIPGVSKVTLIKQCLQELATENSRSQQSVVYFA
jgi:hypothetical protein